MKKKFCMAAAFAAVFALASFSNAATTLWNEGVSGDITGDRLNPLAFTLAANDAYSIIATSNQGDREYVALTIPSGKQLSQVNLVSYVGADGTAFIGVIAGSTFTEPPTGTNVTNLLGYTHFGTGPNNVGTNILPSIGTGPGAIGFTGALPSNTYTFWIQQTSSASPSTYQFDFVVVPEPGAMSLLLIGGVALTRRFRHVRHG